MKKKNLATKKKKKHLEKVQNKIRQLILDVFGRKCIITSSIDENDSDTKHCRVKLIHSPKI